MPKIGINVKAEIRLAGKINLGYRPGMDIETLIKTVGGAREAAKLTGIPRQTIESWCGKGRAPAWRADAVAIIAKAATEAKKPPKKKRAA